MPIRSDLKHLYTGPEYEARRESILLRANNCCERCFAPNRTTVVRQYGWWTPFTLPAAAYNMGWSIDGVHGYKLALPWRHEGVTGVRHACFGWGPASRVVRVILTLAHLDHDPTNNDPANLAALCQWCHLHQDRKQHAHNRRVTRAAKTGQAFLIEEAAQRI